MASDPSASEPSLFEWLTDDLLVSVLLPFLAPGRTRPSMLAAVNLSSTCKNLRARLDAPIAVLRAQLPPPYTAAALDEALASGDAEAATPLLQEAMRRLGRNLEKINGRLLDRGYPVATSCALSGRRYLAPMEDLDERVAALRERGLEVPLVLLELWRSLGGFALAVRLCPSLLPFLFLLSAHVRVLVCSPQSPMDGAHIDWWRASAPEVEAHFGHQTPQQPTVTVANGDPFLNNPFNMNLLAEDEEDDPLFAPVMPDPLWIDHGTAVLTAADDAEGQPEYTLPVSFSHEEGFAFRTGHVLHLAPDAFSKRQPHSTAASAPGTYACWLEPNPALNPELLRFTPPVDDELGGAEPLWRPQCSLLRYLRLAVLEAGGFPGCLGLAAYEPLRQQLTEGLLPF